MRKRVVVPVVSGVRGLGFCALAALAVGCSFAGSKADDAGRPTGSGGSASGSGGTTGSGGSVGGATGSGGVNTADFIPANIGKYKLGAPVTDGMTNPGGAEGCNTITGVVRDVKGANEAGHPDFESFQGDTPTLAMVAATLGGDSKPVYSSKCEAGVVDAVACPWGQQSTNKAAFDQWYRGVDGVTKAYLVYFLFAPGPGGVSTFESRAFFPLDNAGWGNSGTDATSMQRNFGFTTELHTKFKYNGGETFTFIGDDDLWAFVNGKLAMDLGGLHPTATGTINLDAMAAALGITKGNTYALDLFHAERHTNASNFRVDTNFTFVDCGTVVP